MIIRTVLAAVCLLAAPYECLTNRTDFKFEISSEGQWKHDGRGWWYDNGDGTYPKSDWALIGNEWYHFDTYGYMQTGWISDQNSWYYLKSSGAMQKSGWAGNYWLKADGRMAVSEWVDGGRYYVGSDGLWMPDYGKPHWVKDNTGWWYDNGDGTYPKSDWALIGNEWYHFDTYGYMQTGWISDQNSWYYLKSSGAMQKSGWAGNYWLKADGRMAVSEWVDGGRYYVGSDGLWIPDYGKPHWVKDNTGWWYDNGDGTYPVSVFRKIGGATYWFNSRGYMVTGWCQINSKWYYFESSGAMVYGYQTIDGVRWHFNELTGEWDDNLPDSKILEVTRMPQEKSWYCAVACTQMILHCYGYDFSQDTLAVMMNTYAPGQREDGITGTYDSDVAYTLNEYLFGGQPQSVNDGGYRVQSLPASFSDTSLSLFRTRVVKNIDDGYPSILQIRGDMVYGNGSSVNHNVLVIGYEENGNRLYILDPYFEGDRNGISLRSSYDLFRAVISTYEPSYIW